MEFMTAYKRLDKICRDMNDIGVTGYIEDMQKTLQGEYAVDGWKEDYRNLKHYRWVRNRIAHEVGVFEEDLCTEDDVKWLENFYNRIMDCSDPLACYAKIKRKKSKKMRYLDELEVKNSEEHNIEIADESENETNIMWIILPVIAAAAFLCWYCLRG